MLFLNLAFCLQARYQVAQKLRRWAWLSGQVAGTQILVQGINAVTGLLLVRGLPKEEYAWFTLAGSLFATVALLGDGGVSTGLTSIGGRLVGQPQSFGQLLKDALRLSRRLCVLGIVLAFPFFYRLFRNIDTPPSVIGAILVLACLAAWPSLSTVVLNAANRLHRRVGVVQVSDMACALTRLVLTGAVLFGGWLAAIPALIATVAGAMVQACIAGIKTRPLLQVGGAVESYRAELRGFVRSLYANHLFYCLQAQVSTWIMGLFAGSNEIADLGALARLGVIFTALLAPFTYLAVPAIARIQSVGTLRVRFTLVFVISIGAAGLLGGLAWWQPYPFLWILGSRYQHLTTELPLALCSQGFSMVAALVWTLVLIRGWVRHAWIAILTTILGFVVGGMIFPLQTVKGMLLFNMVSALPTLLFCLTIIVFHLSRKSPAPSVHHP